MVQGVRAVTEPLSVTEIDADANLDWTTPAVVGDYVLRYTATGNEGTVSDDVVVSVVALPSGPQSIHPTSIPSQARVGEPTVGVDPPAGAEPTLLGQHTILGETFYLGFGLPQDLTMHPESIPSRAIVGEPVVSVDPVPVIQTIAPDSIPSRARVGVPAVTVGAAPPGLPVTDLTISLYAIVDGEALALPDFASLTLSPLRNSGGSITLDYPPTGLNFAVLRDAITGGRDVEIEIWMSGTSFGAMRGYLQEASGDDTAEAGGWQFGGGFLGLRMDEAWIEPQELGPLIPDDDDNPDNDEHANEKRELIFNASTAGTVMATAMQQAYARGVLGDIVYDFTGTHDSDGVPWPQVITTKFSPGASYKQLLDRLVTLQLAEWDVTWDGAHRVLQMWVPAGRGEDLTELPTPVVLRHGQNILDAPRKWSVREAGTTVMVAGADGLYDDATDETALARRGRRIERFISANNLADAQAVLAYAINQLPLTTSGLHEVTHGVGFLAGSPRPVATFDVGDWVFSESNGTLERLRIVQWTLTVDSNQRMSGTVTLNDTLTDALVRLQARLDAITSGETVVGTSTPPGGSLEDITPPAAPEGLVASSIAYQDPSHSQTLASVTVGWLPVVTNADGSNHPLVQAARYIIIALGNINPDQPDTIVHEDWTWTDCPQVVADYNDPLLVIYEADGSPGGLPGLGDVPAQITWLQNYVDTFSATPTATDDVAGYHVRYTYIGLSQVGGLPSSDPFPDDERFYYQATPGNGIPGTSWTFGGVEGGANLRIEVQAFDRSGNHGPWASIGHDTAVDDTPPPQPTAPTLSVWFSTIDIHWNGRGAFGEPVPVDFDRCEVWISRSADFSTISTTPTLATAFDPLDVNPQHVANLRAAETWNQPDIPYGVGWYAALRAIDRSGNASVLSDVVGPVSAEKLFPDDLRDSIINDPRMIAHETIGTAHIVNAAIVNALIADLAVDNGKIANLEVGKLRSGTMTAQVTISGKFRTHASDSVNRVEFDAAGIRLYRGTAVVGDWNVSSGNIMVTGTYQSALSGARINIFPDGTLRFYPTSGINYSQMSNVGSDVVWRGPVDSNGRSGRVNVNVTGVGMNYSAESEIPSRLRSEIVLFDRRTRMTAAFQAIEVDGRYENPAGGVRRVQFSQLSSSGTTMPYSYLSYGTSSSSGRGGFFGNGAGFKFEAGQMLVTDDGLNSFGVIKASDVVETSSREAKRDIVPARTVLDPRSVIKRASARSYRYKSDSADAPPRFGVIAEELPAELQRLAPDGKGGMELSVSLGSQIGLLWAAVEQLIEEQEGRQ
jgi:hypothetical protein